MTDYPDLIPRLHLFGMLLLDQRDACPFALIPSWCMRASAISVTYAAIVLLFGGILRLRLTTRQSGIPHKIDVGVC
jgi:hypothetical protein